MYVPFVPMLLLNIATSTELDFCTFCPVLLLMFQIFPLIFPPLSYKAHKMFVFRIKPARWRGCKFGEKHSPVLNKDIKCNETAVCIYQKG